MCSLQDKCLNLPLPFIIIASSVSCSVVYFIMSVCLFVCVVYSTLLSRVLGLEGEVSDPSDFKMCVTVFHYSNYFISEAGWVCLLSMTSTGVL